jgi:hypothetical protein
MHLYLVRQTFYSALILVDLILISITEQKHAASMASKVAKWLLDI